MAQKRNNQERIALRMTEKEIRILNNIQASGELQDRSATIRFCINFTKTILSIIPAALAESLIDTSEDMDNGIDSTKR
uniref:Uncharacterized protein n=1 Tax=viral metagenome TaxID=1070528 RepID=A0A6M3LZN0_9ZZZZ